MSRQIRPVKGDYFRIAKDILLKNQEEELEKNVKIHPPGTQFSGLTEELARLFEDEKCSNIEVVLLSNKLDDQGNKVMNDGMNVAEIRPIGVHVFDEELAKP